MRWQFLKSQLIIRYRHPSRASTPLDWFTMSCGRARKHHPQAAGGSGSGKRQRQRQTAAWQQQAASSGSKRRQAARVGLCP